MQRWLFILLVGVFLPCSVHAQSGKKRAFPKLTDNLVALHQQYTAHLTRRSAEPFQSSDASVSTTGDYVVIDAVAAEDPKLLQSELVSLGMKGALNVGRVVSGQLPVSALPAANSLSRLKFARPAEAMTRAGIVTSQGDQAIRANIARTTFALNGSGVTVGVLSDSFDCLGGASTDVANGELSPVNVVSEISSCNGAEDEGRAMLQIVHDVAPGANLAFASAFNGEAAFAANIQALAAAGAKVIVDDVIYFAEPFFQDGIIAQAVESVVANGVAYFSAAGNEARQAYQSVFRAGDTFADGAIPSGPNAPHFFGGVAHNFSSSGAKDHFQRITVPGLATVRFSLQWDSPFFSVSGPPGALTDLDVYVLNSSATQVLAGAAFDSVGGDAVEVFAFTNNSPAAATVNIMIVKFTGPNPGLIKYVRFGSATINEFDTQSGTIFGHSNAFSAESVGAVRYSNTPAFGVSPPQREPFSSAGTTPILFDTAGNRLANPDQRAHKPEIMAADGADTSFFGSSDPDGDGFLNFFGTSAAAPHAAGVAALMFQARPGVSPFRIYASLESSAVDMATPGYDNDAGFGLIDASGAVSLLLRTPLVDFDGDGASDIGIYRNGLWIIKRSSDGASAITSFGGAIQDIPVPADYDGDGRADLAFVRDGSWSILKSTGGTTVVGFGAAGDIPVPADYDGDGKADIAIYSNGVWSIKRSSDGGNTLVGWGGAGFQPVPADYDGDGKADIAVYKDGVWSILRSSDGGNTLVAHGGSAFTPVPADYDGDGKADVAVYQTAGVWSIIQSSNNAHTAIGFGGPAFTPVPADYDGDGKADIAVYHPSGVWSILRSSDNGNTIVGYGGAPQDVPLSAP